MVYTFSKHKVSNIIEVGKLCQEQVYVSYTPHMHTSDGQRGT